MKPHPLKLKFLGITHEEEPVRAAMERFKEALSGQVVRLYIEGSPNQLSLKSYEYKPLVDHANAMGIEVVPLDTDRGIREYNKLHKALQHELDEGEINRRGWLYLRYRNREFAVREKAWAEALRNAPARSVVVMHPIHAERMISRMRMPPGNLVYKDLGAEAHGAQAELGDEAAGVFDHDRLMRKLYRARDRRLKTPD